MTENLVHEIAMKRFISIKDTIKKGLFEGNRLLPKRTTDIKDILFNHTRIVSDEEYLEEYLKYNRVFQFKGVEDGIKKHATKARASYSPPLFGEPSGQILIKETFLVDGASSDDTVLEVILEELSHSYYKSGQMKFEDIPENSVRLFPYSTKAEYIEELNSIRRERYANDFQTDPSKLIVKIIGFVNSVWDPELGKSDGLQPYPINFNQLVLEETRALLLKTIFFAKVQGSKISPLGSVMDQIFDGLIYVSKLNETVENMELLVGQLFFSHYSNGSFPKKDDLQTLISILHDADPDIFYEKIFQMSSKYNLLSDIFKRVVEVVKRKF